MNHGEYHKGVIELNTALGAKIKKENNKPRALLLLFFSRLMAEEKRGGGWILVASDLTQLQGKAAPDDGRGKVPPGGFLSGDCHLYSVPVDPKEL